jgi:hypothetical protein
MLTRKKIIESVNDITAKIEQWETANTESAPFVQWRGRPTRAISELLVESFESLFVMVDTMEIEQDGHAIALAVDSFMEAYDHWAEQSELSPEEMPPGGSPEMWSAWREVVGATADKPVRRLEPIKQLLLEKVSERQIALMYGWRQSDGSPDIEKVREEKEKPGTHYDPKTWVHPQDAADAADVAARWKQRQTRSDAEVAAQPQPAPESLDDLIRQDVPSKQIARMLGIDVDAVRTRAAQIGVSLDGQFVPSVSQHDKMQDIRDADTAKRQELAKLASQEAMVDRVLSLAESMKPSEIAKNLSGEYPSLTTAKVAAILTAAKTPAEA